ncbi:hypothetical protein [Xanthobacter agilis]|jgi:hypothetical protein|uniref:Transcriptional regulator n=1 Tax=Xanthobacter agilis TaxID=47492 RepID=A0ABU0LAG9_XANAG|nr:hypothetical protein [Xanthobacter agilis]MDQ0504126.1 hypothetical protein [Xanthobacter agilis]
MTPITTHQTQLSSSERRRQLEESTAHAMERYRSDFEAVREKTSRLRAEREAREVAIPLKQSRKSARVS